MNRVWAIAATARGALPLAVVAAALAQPAVADAQSDALLQAQRICHDTTITTHKKPSAFSGWQRVSPDDAALRQAGTARMLLFGGTFEVPYQLDPASLNAALPTLAQGIDYEADDMRWLAREGFIAFLEHDSGWIIGVETDRDDPTFTSCILWHSDLSNAASSTIQNLTGVFSGYPKPFQTLTEVNAWLTRGTFDHDLYIAVSRPQRDIYPDFAEVYVMFEHYSYDLTEDY